MLLKKHVNHVKSELPDLKYSFASKSKYSQGR